MFAINMATGMPTWTYTFRGTRRWAPRPQCTQTSLVLVASLNGTVTALHKFSGALAWQTTVGGQLEGRLHFAGGTAYVRSDNGTITAINAKTGSIIWSDSVGAAAEGAPAVNPPPDYWSSLAARVW